MKQVVLILFGFLFFISSAKAETDADFYAKVYQQIHDEYLFDVEIPDLAMNALKGLSMVDDKLKIASNEQRVSLYYDAKSYKSATKPFDLKDAKAWGEFTVRVVAEAKEASKEIKAHDFELKDYLLLSLFSNLDKDSKYYPYLDIGEKRNSKTQRYFADRYLPDDVLYMKFGPMNFYTKEKILESLEKHKDYKALIIDLRGNPGGLLSEAISIMKVFLDDGVIVSTKGRDIDSTNYYVADKTNLVKNKPIVVLIDGDTASSAEVLTSSLVVQLGAKVVGTQSKGKGTVQKLVSFPNGGEAALTSSYYYIPSGESVEGRGVRPTICTFELSENENPQEVLDTLNNRVKICPRESRPSTELEVEVAQLLLKE
ncbi:MAG: S41 family peptidase [Alphaproteobacteria bacterium]